MKVIIGCLIVFGILFTAIEMRNDYVKFIIVCEAKGYSTKYCENIWNSE